MNPGLQAARGVAGGARARTGAHVAHALLVHELAGAVFGEVAQELAKQVPDLPLDRLQRDPHARRAVLRVQVQPHLRLRAGRSALTPPAVYLAQQGKGQNAYWGLSCCETALGTKPDAANHLGKIWGQVRQHVIWRSWMKGKKRQMQLSWVVQAHQGLHVVVEATGLRLLHAPALRRPPVLLIHLICVKTCHVMRRLCTATTFGMTLSSREMKPVFIKESCCS